MLFGDRIKQLRKEKNCTQKELSDFIGISDRIVGYYESNNRFPKDEIILLNIAEFFDVSIDWLLGRTDIRSFSKDGSNIIHIDSEGLSQEDIDKIKEYASMLKNKSK